MLYPTELRGHIALLCFLPGWPRAAGASPHFGFHPLLPHSYPVTCSPMVHSRAVSLSMLQDAVPKTHAVSSRIPCKSRRTLFRPKLQAENPRQREAIPLSHMKITQLFVLRQAAAAHRLPRLFVYRTMTRPPANPAPTHHGPHPTAAPAVADTRAGGRRPITALYGI